MNRTRKNRSTPERRGATLLIALFVLATVSSLVVNILSTQTIEWSAVRNTLAHEQALYMASAGVHRAAAELEANSAWVGTVDVSAFGFSYSVTAVDNGLGGVSVTSTGTVSATSRALEATIEL
ncbi:hypothetical protein [Pseudobythopirellula maris]|uniref:hypothetical protein n=1 Tax=Pseudobythopirellula maris TaxID=2527991 RepID=UPI0011B79FDC|nr:hypothetical protein [Pseudobythopirellula maris]